MMWLDPMPTDCPACGGRFPVAVAELRSLRATCPDCGASFAAVGEQMLAVEARFYREVDPFIVAYELEERAGLGIPDDELSATQSLDDLVRAVADRLPQVAGATVAGRRTRLRRRPWVELAVLARRGGGRG